MDHRVPKVGVALSLLLAFASLLTFVFLNKKFEGPDPTAFIGSSYELTARFNDSATLPTKQAVLYKGVEVGKVSAVTYDKEAQQAVVTFDITGEFDTIYSDAKVRIGERSLLGDAYLNLVDPGTPEAEPLSSGEEVTNTLPSVRFDEALDFLDEEGRDRVRSLIDTVAEGASPEGNGYRLNGTIGGVTRTTKQLRLLTDSLRGQEEQIAGLVSNSATVLDELGSRETALRTIVASGRSTLDALASNTTSLQQALEELPRLLEAGRTTLADIRPLLISARPLVQQLGEIAPILTPALEEGAPFSIGPISSELVDVINGLPEQRRVSERLLPKVARLTRLTQPVVKKAGPAALNTVPVADYLAPRTNSIAAFFANGASVIDHSDDVGRYARFGFVLDPGLGLDAPVDGNCQPGSGAPTVPGPGFCYNAYPQANDALDNQPFVGEYPRIFPYSPPDPKTLSAGG